MYTSYWDALHQKMTRHIIYLEHQYQLLQKNSIVTHQKLVLLL